MIFDYTPGNLLVVELDKRKHLSRIVLGLIKSDDLSDKKMTKLLKGTIVLFSNLGQAASISIHGVIYKNCDKCMICRLAKAL